MSKRELEEELRKLRAVLQLVVRWIERGDFGPGSLGLSTRKSLEALINADPGV